MSDITNATSSSRHKKRVNFYTDVQIYNRESINPISNDNYVINQHKSCYFNMMTKNSYHSIHKMKFNLIAIVILALSIILKPELCSQIAADQTGNIEEAPEVPGHDSVDTTNSDSPPENESIQHPPEILGVVRLDDHSIVLKWDLHYTAQPYLQFFKIQYRSTKQASPWKTEKRDILPTTRAHQLNGFMPGNYFFVVSAIYNNDDNVRSSQYKYKLRAGSKISPDLMPEQKAPEITYTNASSDYFRFRWSYKIKDKDMEDFGYLVYYRSAHQVTDFSIYNTLEESVEIAQVEPETPYEAKVLAYNNFGVSEFSETIRIKTLPNNEQSTTTPSSSLSSTTTSTTAPKAITSIPTTSPTTPKPTISSANTSTSTTPKIMISSTTPIPLLDTNAENQITAKTISPITTTATITTTTKKPYHEIHMTTTTTSAPDISTTYYWLQDEMYIAVRWSLLVSLSLLFIFHIVICWMCCTRSTPTTPANEPMHIDLEINSYFKNSFPGVERAQ